ncbi:MAG TPA: AarF/ABC1/UbiB kinase family protein [Polyangiaceae bacterium]|nr:AarF/ABC1/UbiB kinase family protein [Polyangiaceae bacterium]
MSDDGRPSSRVPSGRFSRLLQLGGTASRMAAEGAAERVRRLASKAEEELPHVLLTAKNAKLLAERLSRLRGAAMKVGQMLSMEGDNLLPPEFAKALEILRSSAHRMPRSQVEEVLRREYGKDYASRFGSLSLEPMASASIGQVHAATTLTGESIVLKIQYPGVAESIDSDVDNLRSLLAMTRLAPQGLSLDELTEEIKAELRREVDYGRELEQLVAYRRVAGELPGVRIPRPYPELSTSRILALERVPGVPLLDWSKTAPQAERNRVGRQLFELLLGEFFEFGLMQTDPNPANFFYDSERAELVLLDFGATRAVPPETSDLYRRAFRGIEARDSEVLRTVLDDLGFRTHERPGLTNALLETAFELSHTLEPGPYDFRTSRLSVRMNERARALREFKAEMIPPPPAYMFFQRKLGGTFLLCRNLGSVFDGREVLEEFGVLDYHPSRAAG